MNGVAHLEQAFIDDIYVELSSLKGPSFNHSDLCLVQEILGTHLLTEILQQYLQIGLKDKAAFRLRQKGFVLKQQSTCKNDILSCRHILELLFNRETVTEHEDL